MKAPAIVALALLLAAPGSGAAQERWQLELDSGAYLWDLRLVKLDGPVLLVRQADTTVAVPVRDISELRLVHASTQRVQVGAGGGAEYRALAGVDDEVYRFALRDLAERLTILRDVLGRHPPAGS